MAGKKTMPSRARRASPAAEARVAREDWITTGFTAFAQGGMRAIAVDALAKRLGVTKGSFYWHFESAEELLAALAERWEMLSVDRLIGDVILLQSPRETLKTIVEHAVRPAALEPYRFEVNAAALADWHPVIRPVFVRITERRLTAMIALYRACGLDEALATRWGRIALMALLGIYPLRLARGRISEAEENDIIDEFCCRMIPPASAR